MQERRQYVRLNIPLEISYAVQGEKTPLHKTVTKNISPNGARFILERDLPKGTIVEMEVKIPTRPEAIRVKAKVIWTKKQSGPDEQNYDAGLEFIQISEENKNDFFQYFCNLMYDQFKKIE
ncbi:MAG: PilZ domain-containing protein [Candidatus Omnitrophica bacterium]|nr:PilZ domain-containing protein [Candidatus Omnitrophota bacterium]